MNGQLDYTFILAGKFGVGKTAIFKRIQTGEYLEQSSILMDNGPKSGGSDAELEHHLYTVRLSETEYNVSIWDTGGLEKFRSMTSSYYRYSSAVILVYDSRPDQIPTLFNLDEWIREAKERSFLRDRVVLSLWANKWDDGGMDTPEVTAFKQEHNIPDCLHFRVSAKTGLNIIESLNILIKFVHQSTTSGIVNSGSETVDSPVPKSPSRVRRACSKC